LLSCQPSCSPKRTTCAKRVTSSSGSGDVFRRKDSVRIAQKSSPLRVRAKAPSGKLNYHDLFDAHLEE
jgi:hypothetical protein